MKHIMLAVAIAALLVSCEKENITHTGDVSGTLYGVWALDSKSIVYKEGNQKKTSNVDYSPAHFYLWLNPIGAVSKKGSFLEADLDDVDVKGTLYVYNANQRKIDFKDRVRLLDEGFSYDMNLKGVFDVLELTDKKFVISQKEDLLDRTTVYYYHRFK